MKLDTTERSLSTLEKEQPPSQRASNRLHEVVQEPRKLEEVGEGQSDPCPTCELRTQGQ